MLCIVLGRAVVVWNKSSLQDLAWKIDGKSNVPIGPITDKEIIQRIYLDTHILNDPFSIGLKLATYRRENTGVITIELIQGENQQSYSLESKEIQDNKWVDFEFSPENYAEGYAQLKITGMGATSEAAPTAWAFRGDGGVPQPLLIDGKEKPFQLKVRASKIVSQSTIASNFLGGRFIPLLFLALIIAPLFILMGSLAINSENKC